MFTRSIRFRLQTWQAFLLICILSGFGVTAYQLHRSNEFVRIDEGLDRRVAALVADLRLRFPAGPHPGRPPGGPEGDGFPPEMPFFPSHDFQPPPRRMGPRGSRGGGDELQFARPIRLSDTTLALFDETATNGFYFAVWSRNGTLLRGSSNAPAALPRPVQAEALTGIRVRTRNLHREAFQFTGLGECMVAGRSITTDLLNLERFAWWLVAAGGGVLCLGLGGGWLLASRALRPVDDISAAATRIASGRLSERINLAETDNELGRLAGVLNSTFARLESAFAQQRQFTADASHELRTPLAVIVSETQTALARERPAMEYRESLEICLEAAQQMRRLSQSLLELARFDAGQEALQRAPFDLADQARAVSELVTPLARERGLHLDTDLSPAPLVGDADRLTQVISNLVTNAIWYNRPDGRIRVATRSDTDGVVLTVADTGIGIPPEDLRHVFERFHRADRARGRAEGHHGLGLAICRAVVDAHSGTIEVTSEPGTGTTFTVRLPAAAVPCGSPPGP